MIAAETSQAARQLANAYAAAMNERFLCEVEARAKAAGKIAEAGRRLAELRVPAVQELHALSVVGYLRYIFNEMRYALIAGMVPALLLVVALNNYTFVPSRYMLALSWTVILTASAVSLIVFVQMDRDVSLSEIGNSAPGKVTLDRAFLSNIFAYALLPLLALISSQLPEVGQLLGRWLDPLSRILEVG